MKRNTRFEIFALFLVYWKKITLGLLLGILAFTLFFFRNSCSGNCKNGLGTMKYWDGTTYIGNWGNGEKSGYGVLLNHQKKIVFSGRWKNNEPDLEKKTFTISAENLKKDTN